MNLRFKPVHSGLGFHPFENGLPYAPAQPKAQMKRQTLISSPAVSFESKKINAPELDIKAASTPAKRLSKWAATALDAVLLAGVASLVLLIVLFSQGLSLASLTQGFSPVFVGLYYVAFHYSILTAQEVLTHKSFGKAFFGLEIDSETDVLSILFRSAPVKHS